MKNNIEHGDTTLNVTIPDLQPGVYNVLFFNKKWMSFSYLSQPLVILETEE